MMTIDVAPVIAALNGIAAFNHAAWLREVGEYELGAIQQRIRSTKVDPDGTPWPPWADSTRRQRERKGNADQGLLWDTGHLLGSIRYEVGGDLSIGTDVDYAQWLQGGTRHMPARPFIGWSDADAPFLESSLTAHLNALLL